MIEMLKTLMADRFQLKFHWETRELPTLWLSVGKNGPKIQKAVETGRPGGFSNRGHSIDAHKMTIRALAAFVEGELQRPVVDKTGLEGDYDFKLEWTEEARPAAPGELPDVEKPSLFAAVEEQLGLKLELHPGPVQVFVIDHAEKPTVN